MDFTGTFFPSMPDEESRHSQRSYSYDPKGSLSVQNAQAPELLQPTAENITWHTIFGVYSPRPPSEGNLRETKPVHESQPGWWQYLASYDWNELRGQGVGYGLYVPHLPQHPVPVSQLYSPGSGFVLPATFLGQPIAPRVKPPGT